MDILNRNNGSLVSGTENDDTIANHASNVTIAGGKGDDFIFLNKNFRNTTILYDAGDGSDRISGFNTTSTLNLGGANYKSAKKIDNAIVINVGNAEITLQSVENLSKLNIVGNFSDKPMRIFNYESDPDSERIYKDANAHKYLIGGNKNDTIYNSSANVTIDAGAGNDSIYNGNAYALIETGDGNDTIDNSGGKTSVNGGAGDDSIKNNGISATINGGAGNDTISNEVSEVTINAGEGNDFISNDSKSDENGKNVLYRYYEGDGNDTITGFRADSSLNVVNANYTTSKSGNDIIVTVGDGKVILQGAATLSAVNISKAYDSVDKPVNINNRMGERSLVGGNNDDTIKNYDGYKVTIAGNDGNDLISNGGVRSIINGGLDDDTISNSAKESTVDGGDGDDLISNSAKESTINGGGGNDFIDINAERNSINGGDGNDTIKNIGEYNKIEGGDGNDSIISNYVDELTIRRYVVTINGGEGNDYIESYSFHSKIFGDAGNDTIKTGLYSSFSTIDAGAGDDYIENKASTVLFRYNKGDGNDYIVGFYSTSSLGLASGVYADTSRSGNDIIATIGENKVTLAGAASLRSINIVESPDNINNTRKKRIITTSKGDDTIKNSGALVTINSRGGNDLIDNSGYRVMINSDAGNDSITNSARYSTISGGADNDTISDSGDSVSIDGGAGNDRISLSGSKTTIIGGKGDDSVINDGNNVVFRYNTGDGNDVLSGFYQDSKIFIADGKYYSQIKGDDVILTVGDGKITLEGAAVVSRPQIENLPVSIRAERDKEMIIGTDARESVYNNHLNVTIQTNGGNDYINNTGYYDLIDSGNGDDEIFNGSTSLRNDVDYRGQKSTIQAGEGNDTIRNTGYMASIDGGDGNDVIRNSGLFSLVTIKGGKGDDKIYNNSGDGVTFQYAIGDGNDYISGFNENSTLDLGGEEYSSVKGYYDIIVTVGDDRITLAGATALKTVNINGVINQPLEIDNSKDDSSVVGSSYGDTISNSGKNVTIDAQSGGDSISNSADSVTIDGGTGYDTVTNSGSQVSITGGAGNDKIFNSGAQVSITGGAGNDTITNNGSNVTIEGGALYHDAIIIGEKGDNALIKYKVGDGDDKIIGFKTNSTLLISGGVPAVTETIGNDIIATVGENKITLEGAAALKTVNIIETPVNIHNSAVRRSFGGTNANDTIVNSGDKATIQGFKGDDSINNNAAYVSLAGGEGADNISNTGKNSTLLGNGGNDSIYNNAAKGLVLGSEDGESIFNHGEGSTISGDGGSDTIENYTNSNRVSIAAGTGDDSIKNAGHNVTIEGGAGNDTVISSTGTSNFLSGGEGSDFISIKGSYKNTILGGAGNDTVSLDWGSNRALIQYNAGDGSDLIEGFNSTATLKIGDGTDTYDKAIEGDDVIITVGEENITLKGAAKLARLHIAGVTQLKVNNVINATSIIGDRLNDSIINSGHKVTISAVAGDDTIENSGRYVSISGGADDDTISSRNANFVTINGGDGSDTITAANSNFLTVEDSAGNDIISVSGGVRNTITGGKGDDSIYLSETEDILIKHGAGDGSDYISGFNENSTLQIGSDTDTYTRADVDGNIIITVGDEKITLAGAENLASVNIIGTQVIAGRNISNSDGNIVLNGNAGNDTISNSARNVTINGNDGNDTIRNTAQNVNISSGAGKDSINNSGSSTTLEGDAGNDLITNSGGYVSINGGAGDDTIDNSGDNAKIVGGAGVDSIYNTGNNATISGKSGNDSITNHYGSNVVFDYVSGDGNDTIWGFRADSTLNISGLEYATEMSGNDVIVSVGGGAVTIKDAAQLSKLNIAHVSKEFPMDIANTDDEISVVGTSFDDTISNKGEYVTITAQGGNDSIFNAANNATIDAGAGNDTVVNDYAFYSSIAGGEGSDLISVASSSQVTINAGKANDTISLSNNDETFIEYNAGDGSDLITGFDEYSTLNIIKSEFTSATADNDLIITVGDDKITLEGAATLSNPHVVSGTHATFTIKNSTVTYETDLPESVIKDAYQFNATNGLLTINDSLKDKKVEVKADAAAKVNWHYGSASLSKAGTLEYQLEDGKNTATLTSKNYDDKIIFSENTTFNYGRIQAEVQANSTVSTKAANRIAFENNSSASVTARRDCIIDVAESNITVNDLPINAIGGAGTVTVKRNGLSFEGCGAQFVDLEVAKESYFGKLAPMTIDYDSSEEIYTVYNTASVKTLANDFTKLKFDFSGNDNDKYAYYKINDVEILTTKDDDTSVIEVNDRTFKVEDKELDAEKIGRITLDDKITFSGTEIKYNGVEVNYSLNKPVVYSLDGEEITISDAATVTTSDESKTFNCAAGSYVINRKTFETTTDLKFTADENEIKIPMSDAKTEIYFDGVKVSGIQGGELVFYLAEDRIFIPSGATLNITSPAEVKLNLAAGDYTIDGKEVSIATELEITADKDNIKVPLSEDAVTINGAAITGTDEATIDNTEELFCSILLPDGALVENVSDNVFGLTGGNNSASFGDANKKVLLTEDGTAYIEFNKENSIGVGFNQLVFENVEIQGDNAWTVETSGTNGIDKITGIKSGATISTTAEEIDFGDLRFEVETDGVGDFTLCGQKFTATDKTTYVVYGNSSGEIKVAPSGEEYADDDSEAAGKVYQYDAAGDYTVNGITFHAEKNSKVKTITRGVEFDLSTGTFRYDGLTLSGSGTAQINRYNTSLISLTDGAKVSGSDESKYNNRQFEIEGTVELIGKKFETDKQISCGLIKGKVNEISLNGFFVDGEYVDIQSDCYDTVKVADGKIASIEGVKTSANIAGNGLSNISIATTGSGEFTIKGKTYKISGDSDGVTFVTDSHGNISEINGLAGSVEGNFENRISVNGKVIRLTGLNSVQVTSDGTNITEISNVAGDLVTADGKTYRKDVRVYDLGGAEKLTTSADGTIIFNGNKFKASAGKTFTLDSSGNVSGIGKNAIASANVAESDNLATIDLTTTDGLEEVFGDFSEGLTVNGVFVRVTDSTNFVVKDDGENIYIETTAADTFTINGKTFDTYADKTIFKLDTDGNVSEIVTDNFYLYPDEETYLIAGDFNDEIIFNGKKFRVTGTNDTSIFLDDETLIGVELARNAVEVVESGGADDIAISGAGDITIGGKTFSTSDDFTGSVQTNLDGSVDSIEDFIGTISGELGGLDLAGLKIDSGDFFSVTGDGEKIIAIENLANGTFTSGDVNGLTINGEKISVDNSQEVTITDGALKTAEEPGEKPSEETPSSTEEISDMFSGDADKITVSNGRATIKNYDAKSGDAFITKHENIAEAISENAIAYDDGKLTVNAAQITFADDADSRFINFINADGDTQKVGFVSDDSKLDASKESGNLILVGAINSTLKGGNGKNQIYLDETGDSTILLNGRNTIASFDDSDRISLGANYDFNFDGENISVKSGAARALLQNISSGNDSARILVIKDGKETKTAIAQAGAVISVGDELADVYCGKKSGVDFSAYEESLTIDLSKNFYGVNQITVGGGLNTLIGTSANEIFTSNSDGITEFIFGAGSGRDVISNFNFAEDKISVDSAVSNVVLRNSGDVIIQRGDDWITLENAQGKIFRINEYAAQVDENISYDEAANYFLATAKKATVTVSEEAEIWLDGSHGKNFVGNIRTLDATTSNGKNTLAGNDLDNTISAGAGDASLWGGNGGDDLLVGGTGANMFFYTTGNGDDTIQGANDGDLVYLSSITLDQISSTEIAQGTVAINFTDGGKLNVESSKAVEFVVEGETYIADHATGILQKK